MVLLIVVGGGYVLLCCCCFAFSASFSSSSCVNVSLMRLNNAFLGVRCSLFQRFVIQRIVELLLEIMSFFFLSFFPIL